MLYPKKDTQNVNRARSTEQPARLWCSVHHRKKCWLDNREKAFITYTIISKVWSEGSTRVETLLFPLCSGEIVHLWLSLSGSTLRCDIVWTKLWVSKVCDAIDTKTQNRVRCLCQYPFIRPLRCTFSGAAIVCEPSPCLGSTLLWALHLGLGLVDFRSL